MENKDDPALQVLKVSTLGTAMYGLYMAYALHLQNEIQKEHDKLPAFNTTDLETAYLMFVLSDSNNTTMTRNALLMILKEQYGVVLDKPLPTFDNALTANWHSYRRLIQDVHTLFTKPPQDRAIFSTRLLTLFCEPPPQKAKGANAHDKRKYDFKAYVAARMSATLDARLGDAAYNANDHLKKEDNAQVEKDRALNIWQQCIRSGAINDTNVLTKTDKPQPPPNFHVFEIITNNCK